MRRVLRPAALAAAAVLWLGSAAAHAQTTHEGHDPAGYAGHGAPQEPSTPEPSAHDEHIDHGQGPSPVVPPLTDEDRQAAFPQLDGQHPVHDSAIQYFVLFDQIEWQGGDRGQNGGWENKGWIGGDLNRFWFRTEGEAEDGELAAAQAHVLYGRAIHRWWDLVVGMREDFRPGPPRTWAAIGIQGLAPYWFEVEATAYIGEAGRTHFRVETEYELLLTNRAILQPLVEVEIFGKADRDRRIGAGLSSMDAGLRLRYEIRRELAPYVGVTWKRTFFGTADLARAAGDGVSEARMAAGLRVWF